MLLDLSKAFDLKDYILLLSKNNKYHIANPDLINGFNLIYTIDHSAAVSMDHFLIHSLSHEVSYKALFWARLFLVVH